MMSLTYTVLTMLMFALGGAQTMAQSLDLRPEPLGNLPAPVMRALIEAQGYSDAQHYDQAVEVLSACLERYPQLDCGALRLHLGNSLYLAGRVEDARAQYEACVNHDDTSQQGWLQLGRSCWELGDYACAANAFEKLNEILPEPQPLVQLSAGIANYKNGKSEMAYRLLSQLVDGSYGPPTLDWCKAYVSAAITARRGTETRPTLLDLTRRETNNPEVWLLLSNAAWATGDSAQATVALTIADYLDPFPLQELVRLGDLYRLMDIPVKAASYYRRAWAADSDSSSTGLRERLAAAYVAAHDQDSAISFLEVELARLPNARLWSLLGDAYYAQDQYEDALNAFERSVAIDTTNGRAYLMLGYCAYQLDHVGEAREYLESAAAFDDQRASARRLLATLEKEP